MANLTELNRPPVDAAARCPHAPIVSVMVELKGASGEHLQRFSCGKCVHGWWESNGELLDQDETVDKMRELAHGLYKRRTAVKAPARRAASEVQQTAWKVERSDIERFALSTLRPQSRLIVLPTSPATGIQGLSRSAPPVGAAGGS
jgi:transposase-like protein